MARYSKHVAGIAHKARTAAAHSLRPRATGAISASQARSDFRWHIYRHLKHE